VEARGIVTMPAETAKRPASPDVTAINRRFYDAFWGRARLQRPDRFNTWPLISQLLPASPRRLELGPGLRPRLPIAGTHFIDVSQPVIDRLNALGGIAAAGEIGSLPFGDGALDLVCAFDVIEHLEDDRRVFSEMSRVLKDDGVLIFAVPLHPDHWTPFDDTVGHARRYDPSDLLAILERHQLTLEKSAVYGMQPSNPKWVAYGMWWLEHHPRRAMFWYNWVGMPLAMRFQKPLTLVSGLVDPAGVDEVVLVCRRRAR
jgi:SAM-dependent methyltransferase